MKAFIKLNLVVDFPSDVFSNKDENIHVLDQILRDYLYVGVDYSDKQDDFFYVDHLEITKYKEIS